MIDVIGNYKQMIQAAGGVAGPVGTSWGPYSAKPSATFRTPTGETISVTQPLIQAMKNQEPIILGKQADNLAKKAVRAAQMPGPVGDRLRQLIQQRLGYSRLIADEPKEYTLEGIPSTARQDILGMVEIGGREFIKTEAELKRTSQKVDYGPQVSPSHWGRESQMLPDTQSFVVRMRPGGAIDTLMQNAWAYGLDLNTETVEYGTAPIEDVARMFAGVIESVMPSVSVTAPYSSPGGGGIAFVKQTILPKENPANPEQSAGYWLLKPALHAALYECIMRTINVQINTGKLRNAMDLIPPDKIDAYNDFFNRIEVTVQAFERAANTEEGAAFAQTLSRIINASSDQVIIGNAKWALEALRQRDGTYLPLTVDGIKQLKSAEFGPVIPSDLGWLDPGKQARLRDITGLTPELRSSTPGFRVYHDSTTGTYYAGVMERGNLIIALSGNMQISGSKLIVDNIRLDPVVDPMNNTLRPSNAIVAGVQAFVNSRGGENGRLAANDATKVETTGQQYIAPSDIVTPTTVEADRAAFSPPQVPAGTQAIPIQEIYELMKHIPELRYAGILGKNVGLRINEFIQAAGGFVVEGGRIITGGVSPEKFVKRLKQSLRRGLMAPSVSGATFTFKDNMGVTRTYARRSPAVFVKGPNMLPMDITRFRGLLSGTMPESSAQFNTEGAEPSARYQAGDFDKTYNLEGINLTPYDVPKYENGWLSVGTVGATVIRIPMGYSSFTNPSIAVSSSLGKTVMRIRGKIGADLATDTAKTYRGPGKYTIHPGILSRTFGRDTEGIEILAPPPKEDSLRIGSEMNIGAHYDPLAYPDPVAQMQLDLDDEIRLLSPDERQALGNARLKIVPASEDFKRKFEAEHLPAPDTMVVWDADSDDAFYLIARRIERQAQVTTNPKLWLSRFEHSMLSRALPGRVRQFSPRFMDRWERSNRSFQVQLSNIAGARMVLGAEISPQPSGGYALNLEQAISISREFGKGAALGAIIASGGDVRSFYTDLFSAHELTRKSGQPQNVITVAELRKMYFDEENAMQGADLTDWMARKTKGKLIEITLGEAKRYLPSSALEVLSVMPEVLQFARMPYEDEREDEVADRNLLAAELNAIPHRLGRIVKASENSADYRESAIDFFESYDTLVKTKAFGKGMTTSRTSKGTWNVIGGMFGVPPWMISAGQTALQAALGDKVGEFFEQLKKRTAVILYGRQPSPFAGAVMMAGRQITREYMERIGIPWESRGPVISQGLQELLQGDFDGDAIEEYLASYFSGDKLVTSEALRNIASRAGFLRSMHSFLQVSTGASVDQLRAEAGITTTGALTQDDVVGIIDFLGDTGLSETAKWMNSVRKSANRIALAGSHESWKTSIGMEEAPAAFLGETIAKSQIGITYNPFVREPASLLMLLGKFTDPKLVDTQQRLALYFNQAAVDKTVGGKSLRDLIAIMNSWQPDKKATGWGGLEGTMEDVLSPIAGKIPTERIALASIPERIIRSLITAKQMVGIKAVSNRAWARDVATSLTFNDSMADKIEAALEVMGKPYRQDILEGKLSEERLDRMVAEIKGIYGEGGPFLESFWKNPGLLTGVMGLRLFNKFPAQLRGNLLYDQASPYKSIGKLTDMAGPVSAMTRLMSGTSGDKLAADIEMVKQLWPGDTMPPQIARLLDIPSLWNPFSRSAGKERVVTADDDEIAALEAMRDTGTDPSQVNVGLRQRREDIVRGRQAIERSLIKRSMELQAGPTAAARITGAKWSPSQRMRARYMARLTELASHFTGTPARHSIYAARRELGYDVSENDWGLAIVRAATSIDPESIGVENIHMVQSSYQLRDRKTGGWFRPGEIAINELSGRRAGAYHVEQVARHEMGHAISYAGNISTPYAGYTDETRLREHYDIDPDDESGEISKRISSESFAESIRIPLSGVDPFSGYTNQDFHGTIRNVIERLQRGRASTAGKYGDEIWGRLTEIVTPWLGRRSIKRFSRQGEDADIPGMITREEAIALQLMEKIPGGPLATVKKGAAARGYPPEALLAQIGEPYPGRSYVDLPSMGGSTPEDLVRGLGTSAGGLNADSAKLLVNQLYGVIGTMRTVFGLKTTGQKTVESVLGSSWAGFLARIEAGERPSPEELEIGIPGEGPLPEGLEGEALGLAGQIPKGGAGTGLTPAGVTSLSNLAKGRVTPSQLSNLVHTLMGAGRQDLAERAVAVATGLGTEQAVKPLSVKQLEDFSQSLEISTRHVKEFGGALDKFAAGGKESELAKQAGHIARGMEAVARGDTGAAAALAQAGMSPEQIKELAGITTSRRAAEAMRSEGIIAEEGKPKHEKLGAISKLIGEYTSGFELFRLQRMWEMTGAGKTFGQYIPAAAQAELPGWMAATGISGVAAGPATGVAGGVLRARALQQQAMIDAGRTGYQAYGGLMGVANPLMQAQAIVGPALGIGMIGGWAAGGLLSAAGVAAAGPIGWGIGGLIGAATLGYGLTNYQQAQVAPIPENKLKYGLEFRQQGMTQEQIQAEAQRANETLQGIQVGGVLGGNIQTNLKINRLQRAQLAAQGQGPIPPEATMHAINLVARSLAGKPNSVFQGMDEGIIGELIAQNAAYDPEMKNILQPGVIDQIIAKGGTAMMQRSAQLGYNAEQFAPTAQAWRLGAAGAQQLFAAAPTGAMELRGWQSRLEQYAPLERYGFTPTQAAAMPELTGRAAYMAERVMAGEPVATSMAAWKAGMPQFATMEAEMPRVALGTLTTGGLLGQENVARAARMLGGQFTPARLAQLAGGTSTTQEEAKQRQGQEWERFSQQQAQVQSAALRRLAVAGRGGLTPEQYAFQVTRAGGEPPLEGGITQEWIDTTMKALGGRSQREMETEGIQRAEQYQRQQFQFTRGDYARGYAGFRGITPRIDFGAARLREVPQPQYDESGNLIIKPQPTSPASIAEGQRLRIQVQNAVINAEKLTPGQLGQMGLQDRQFFESWLLQGRTSGRQFEWQAEDLERQRERGRIQLGWSEADLRTGYGRGQTQFAWQREDLAFQGNQQSLQFGWGMEDIQEQMRYATGRQKRLLARQAERSTISYGMGMGQLERQGERLETRSGWADEDFAKELDRLEQRRRWLEEDYERDKSRMEEQFGWNEEMHQLALKNHQENMEMAYDRQDAEEKYYDFTIQHQKDLRAWSIALEDQENALAVKRLMDNTAYSDAMAASATKVLAITTLLGTQVDYVKGQVDADGPVTAAWKGFMTRMVDDLNALPRGTPPSLSGSTTHGSHAPGTGPIQ